MTELEKFGKDIMTKCRDEAIDDFNSISMKSRGEDSYKDIGDEDLREIKIERARFFKNLTPEQLNVLDKLILSTIDEFTFRLLREFQENKDKTYKNDTFDIIINGKTTLEMEDDLVSGTLFGDYFDWLEQHSRHGPFQYY